MTELKDERALPIAIEWTQRGKSNAVRGVADRVLGRLASSASRRRTARTTGSSSCSTTSGCACG